MKMTSNELRRWKETDCWAKELLGGGHSVVVKGVCFMRPTIIGITFTYRRHCSGYLYADNGYLGRTEDGKDYYPMIRIMSSYCEYCPFSGTMVEPNLDAISLKVIALWTKFTQE